MKRLYQFLRHPRTRSAITLFFLCLIIWCAGPYIAIDGYNILASADQRLIAILLLALIWKYNVSGFINKFNKSSSPLQQSVQPEELTNFLREASLLRQEVKTALLQFKNATAKKTLLHRFIKNKTPGYLLFGPAQSGKSSLIKTQEPELQALGNYKFATSWRTKDAAFLELNTEFLLTKSTHHPHNLFYYCLNVINQWRRFQAFSGCIFTVPFSQFFSQNRQEQQMQLQSFQTLLRQIANRFQSMPVLVIFTQCDQLAGFSDFFTDLDPEERAQTLGIPFIAIKPETTLAHIFEIQYATLIKRLNERLLWRLKCEHTHEKRAQLINFPLQFEIIRPALNDFIQQIHEIGGIKLMGCYLTSCSQTKESAVDFLTKPLADAYNLHSLTPAGDNKSAIIKDFFIADLFKKVLPQSLFFNLVKSNNTRWIKTIYTASILLLLLGSSYIYENYRAHLTSLDAVQQAMNNTPLVIAKNNNYVYLPKLVKLADALTLLNKKHFLGLSAIGMASVGAQQTQQLKTAAEITYQQILTTQFIPSLQHSLETIISNANSQNPNDLYSALKAYLMLVDAKKRDPQFVIQWFSHYWQNIPAITAVERLQLKQQLTIALQQPFKITANSQMIANAREILNQIPLTQLSYSILLDQYHQPISLFAANDVIQLKDQHNIPSLYSVANFPYVYNNVIPEACQQVINGNWVLGKKLAITANKDAINQLVDQTRSLYMTEYALAWSSLLQMVVINNGQTISQTVATLKAFSGNNSPFWQLLKTIQTNTEATVAIPQFAQISNQFKSLNTFLSDPNAEALEQNLTALKSYIAKINAAKDTNKAAFAASAERMINEDQNNDALENLFQQLAKLPQPLQSWINSVITSSWHVMLTASKTYLNSIWATDVLPPYEANLNHRYPLFQNATTDLSLDDFSNFFAPKGTLSSFFNFYLKPFVDTNTVYWVWKKVDNQSIDIPQTTLEMFIRAALIQKMYFADGGDKPLVKFSLIPERIEPGVSSFNLNLGGQTVNYLPGQTSAAALIWPASHNTVSVEFINAGGASASMKLQGAWAWFKLLEKADLQKTTNPREFDLTFDLNGNAAKYRLLAAELVNPFIPGIINAFRCPDKL